MTFRIILLVFVMVGSTLLDGCVTAKPIYTSEGRQGFAITCSGHRNTWNDCLAEAGEKCQTQGYTVLERNGEAVPIEFHQYSSDTQIQAKLFSYKENNETSASGFHTIAEHRSMVVMCGHPQQPVAPPQ